MNYRTMIMLLLVAFANESMAEGLTTLRIERRQCMLFESGTGSSQKLKGEVNALGCIITMPKQEYEDRFKFCYLSGITVYAGVSSPGSCSIRYRPAEDAYSFLLGASGDARNPMGALDCEFTCLNRKE